MENQIAPKEICAVVVNWRAAEETLFCVEALLASDSAPGRLVVVENGSGDNSAELLKEWFTASRKSVSVIEVGEEPQGELGQLVLLLSPSNGGFAWANNRAMELVERCGSAAGYWLLNNDTRVEPGALAALLRAAVAKNLQLVGSRIVEFDHPARTVSAGGWISPYTGAASRRPAGDQRPPDYLEGASLLILQTLYRTMGPLSEEYFLYYEETDYCYTARRAGFALGVAEDSVVRHRVGCSTGAGGVPGTAPPFIDALQLTNRLRFGKRHLSHSLTLWGGWLCSLLLRFKRMQWARLPLMVRMAMSNRAYTKAIVAHGGRLSSFEEDR